MKKPLTADEIEELLRAARDRELGSQSDFVSDEPLGPGDVQHLRNTSLQDSDPNHVSWPFDGSTADQRLRDAEKHLAAAIAMNAEVPAAESNSHPPYAFQPLASPPTGTHIPVGSLGEIELDVSLELGNVELTIEELLALREGSVVTLDRKESEPIDILANGRLIARGEVIVIDDKFCVRICEVITPG